MNDISYSNNRIGPRAKCDQVVYEAIAKACEIIVRSRCDFGKKSSARDGCLPVPEHPRHNSSSSRFNIEIEEVAEVRKILRRWKQSLHVPLRLDIVSQSKHQNTSDFTKTNGNGGKVLERWCIDYVASLTPRETPVDNNETIAQLRHVCKRVVILLRSLYCFTRMLPLRRLSRSRHEHVVHTLPSSGDWYGHQTSESTSDWSLSYSIFATSTHIGSTGHDLNELSCDFRRKEFDAIPTPFGYLSISVIYLLKPQKQILEKNITLQTKTMEESSEVESFHGKAAVSEFLISNYTNESCKAESKEKIEFEKKKNDSSKDSSKKKVLSNLSLALMNHCHVSQTPQETEEELKPSSHHDVENNSAHIGNDLFPRSYEKPSFLQKVCYQNSGEAGNQFLPCSFDNKPKQLPIVSLDGRNSSNPPETLGIGKKSILPTGNVVTKRTDEYGYGYNGSQHVYTHETKKNFEFSTDQSRSIRKVSPSQTPPLSSTPPFSYCLGNAVSPFPTNESPPFQTHPLALIPPKRIRIDGTIQGSNSLSSHSHSILVPPSTLEVLPMSPFKFPTDSNMILSHQSERDNTKSYPFVGPISSTQLCSGFDVSNNIHRSSISSIAPSSFDDRLDDQKYSCDDLPFAAEQLSDTSNVVAHITEETNSASLFAYRCATASRLSMFKSNMSKENPKSGNCLEENKLHIHSDTDRNANLSNELDEFRNFGASLLKLKGSDFDFVEEQVDT